MAVRTGAQDYLIKGQSDGVLVLRAVCYAIERARLLRDEDAVRSTETPEGILAICSFCKKIRDDEGSWNSIESQFTRHSGVLLSHGICPDCLKREHPDIYREKYGDHPREDAD